MVAAGEDGGAGGGADGIAGVKMGEFDPALGKRVEVRGLDDRVAVESGVSVAEIVGHDENDVRGCGGRGAEQEAKEEGEGGDKALHRN